MKFFLSNHRASCWGYKQFISRRRPGCPSSYSVSLRLQWDDRKLLLCHYSSTTMLHHTRSVWTQHCQNNIYTKHFRKKVNPTTCRIQYQREKGHCGHICQSCIHHISNGITSDLNNLLKQGRMLAKGTSNNVQSHWVNADWDTETPVVKVSADPTSDNRNHCKTGGWTSRDNFIIDMQKTPVKVTMESYLTWE